MSIECEYCTHKFSTKTNLKTHQKRALYCLEIQYKKNNNNKNLNDFQCSDCNKNFTSKTRLTSHVKICKSKDIRREYNILKVSYNQDILLLKQKLEQKDEQIKKLEAQLEQERARQQIVTLASISKPTNSIKNTIKNCTIQNLPPLVESEMKEQLNNLTIDHIREGPKGYAKYALEYSLKNRVACTDSSRKKFKWKNSDGEIVDDNNGMQLTTKFFRVIKEKNFSLCRELLHELGDKYDEAVSSGNQLDMDFISELTDNVCKWRSSVKEASYGNDNEFRGDFVSYLGKMSNSDGLIQQTIE
jgi:DNA-directed RNA polymerase subunit RPC12/RpoP